MIFPDKNVEELYHIINGDKARFLSMCTGLENAIEILIAKYYSLGEEDYQKFLSVIFADDTELSFSKKIKMFERFLKEYFPEYLPKNPDFINQLNRVRKLRNKYAHSINLTPEELKPFVGKRYYKLGFIENGIPKEEIISIDDVVARAKEVEHLLNEMMSFQEKVAKIGYDRFVKYQEYVSSFGKSEQDSEQQS